MQPEDLSQLTVPSDPQIHPDGVRTAFVLTRMDLDEDGYRRQIHVHDGESVQEFTTGQIDAMPRWSPDGKQLAFLRATDVKKPVPQLAVMPVAGGEARLLTEFDLGVEFFTWSPDGRWMCAVAKAWSPELAELTDEERGRRAKRITAFPYRFDNRGWLHDRRRQIWLVDPSGEEKPRRLTDGDFDETMPAWHPNGEVIAFLTDRGPRRGLDPGSDIYEVNLDGRLTQPVARGGWFLPAYSPEGVLHLVGDPQLDYPRLTGLWKVGPDSEVMNLLPDLDRSVSAVGSGLPAMPRWRDGAIYNLVEDSGRVEVRVLGPDGRQETIVAGDRVVTGFDVGPGGRIVAAVSTFTEPGEIVSVSGGDEERLTFYSPSSGLVVRPTEHFRTSSGDGELDVFVLIPDGDGPFPVLLNIHGGPATQYGFGFFDEFQVYVGAGYAVVGTNPRGSAGRGLDFMRAVVGDSWGVVDLADINAALAAALDRFPQLDRQRIGDHGGVLWWVHDGMGHRP